MSILRAIVLRSAGTNCDAETVRALEQAGAEVERLHLNVLSAQPERIDDARLIAIPGGFSYGDYVAAGRIFGLELRRRLGERLRRYVADGGHVLGVCNGFQILVELGLFQPERAPHERTIALTDNASNRFECRWITMRAEDSVCAWLVPGELLPAPEAHAEGRFVLHDADTQAELVERRQVVLRYSGEEGEREPDYPANPNGAQDDIAALADPTGRVLGLMPHPERNLTPWQHPIWTRLPARGEGEGASFYRRLVACAAGIAPQGLLSAAGRTR